MSEQVLEIRGLKTYFYTEEGAVQAVDSIDLQIGKQEVLGLVGESGCGKSTVALSIMRLIPHPGEIVDGEILLNGKDLFSMSEEEIRRIRGGEIAMIFQDPMSSLNPVYSIGDQVAEAVRWHQKIKDNRELRERVEIVLHKVGIPDADKRFNEFPHEFSGGMRQRVMIAMALSCNPQILIADEPTTSLDVTIQAQILDLMKDLQEEFNSSILLITHDLGVVAELSDKVAVMYAGKVVEYSDVVSIFKEPIHPYTRALIGAVPRLDIKQEELETIQGEVPSLIDFHTQCRFHPRCKYARDICKREEPEFQEIKPGHFVSCFFAEELEG
ncbi:MAG: ABC transporter ATP-binding protein [Candidatus Bathyarchaeia archaeon]